MQQAEGVRTPRLMSYYTTHVLRHQHHRTQSTNSPITPHCLSSSYIFHCVHSRNKALGQPRIMSGRYENYTTYRIYLWGKPTFFYMVSGISVPYTYSMGIHGNTTPQLLTIEHFFCGRYVLCCDLRTHHPTHDQWLHCPARDLKKAWCIFCTRMYVASSGSFLMS